MNAIHPSENAKRGLKTGLRPSGLLALAKILFAHLSDHRKLRVDDVRNVILHARRVKKLCGIAVILQHSAESLVAAYAGSCPVVADFPRGEEKDVGPALVVSLRVKMINKI